MWSSSTADGIAAALRVHGCTTFHWAATLNPLSGQNSEGCVPFNSARRWPPHSLASLAEAEHDCETRISRAYEMHLASTSLR